MKIKKTVVTLGYSCNNNCVFCCNSEKRKQIKDVPFSKIKKRILNARKEGATYLELVGGEPTIRKDIFNIIKLAKKLNFNVIAFATNGRMFSNEAFAKKLISAGVNHLIFSIHGHNSGLHDSLTRVPGSFEQLKEGIKNIKKSGFKNIGSNTTIVKQNYEHLGDIGKFIYGLGIRNSEFIFVDPTRGLPKTNFDKLVPTYEDVSPYVNKLLEFGGRKKIQHWLIRYYPLCFIEEKYHNMVSEIYEKQTIITQQLAPDFMNEDVQHNRRIFGMGKIKTCIGCKYQDVCEGYWKEYIKQKNLGTIYREIELPNKEDFKSFLKKLGKSKLLPKIIRKKNEYFREYTDGVDAFHYTLQNPNKKIEIIKKMARILAHLHKEVNPVRKHLGKKALSLYNPLKYVNIAFKTKELRCLFKNKQAPRFYFKGICHGDVYLKNLIVKKDKMTLIDFFMVHEGVIEADLFHTFNSLPQRFRTLFLETYSSYSNLNKRIVENVKNHYAFFELYHKVQSFYGFLVRCVESAEELNITSNTKKIPSYISDNDLGYALKTFSSSEIVNLLKLFNVNELRLFVPFYVDERTLFRNPQNELKQKIEFIENIVKAKINISLIILVNEINYKSISSIADFIINNFHNKRLSVDVANAKISNNIKPLIKSTISKLRGKGFKVRQRSYSYSL